MPLERDEGEYAYAGQLILQGVPPYKEAYNMKLPGTYAAYAVIMAVFGQSASGIHLGLALINAASIILMFLIGRRLLDDVAGAAAAIAFAFMSLSPSVLGLAAHATHFVVLFALAGLLLLLRAPQTEDPSFRNSALHSHNLRILISGVFFGFAFLMKQHGILFGVFGGAYLIWTAVQPENGGDRRRGTSNRARTSPQGARSRIQNAKNRLMRPFALFGVGLAFPYLLVCVVLWFAGVFPQFTFWTISYAGKYASAIPAAKGLEILRSVLGSGVGPSLLFWIVPGLAAVLMWWEPRLSASHRFFLVALLFCSCASVSLGFYFREHYFILLLPVLALLTGVAVSRGLYLLKHDKTIELFLVLPILGVFAISIVAVLFEDGALFFSMTPIQAVRDVYSTTLFSDAVTVSDFLKVHTDKNARVAVMGSEPEIYFYCGRRSATGYIYTYPLMEEHPYALTMQEKMITEIERARPEYVVYVDDDLSWFPHANSRQKIFDWWKSYWANDLDLVTTINVEGRAEPLADVSSPNPPKADERDSIPKHLLVFARKKR